MTAKTTAVIGYLRVSTEKQGKSGLGMEGQKAAIQEYAARTGSHVAEFYVEVESGKNSDRPELAKALARAKRQKATLIVAKLDRLARNVAFLSSLMESGVEFVACDNPHANRLTIHILAAVAEDEARRISERTKAALKAYKARGGVLGASRPECQNLTDKARKLGAKRAGEVLREQADEAYSDIVAVMQKLRGDGQSLQQIADYLNATDQTTRRGAAWNKVQVMRVLARAAA